MADAVINVNAQGWPYLDQENYVDMTPDYTLQLANLLAALGFYRAAGRPDQPTTMPVGIRPAVAAAPAGALFSSTDGVGANWLWQKRGATWTKLH